MWRLSKTVGALLLLVAASSSVAHAEAERGTETADVPRCGDLIYGLMEALAGAYVEVGAVVRDRFRVHGDDAFRRLTWPFSEPRAAVSGR